MPGAAFSAAMALASISEAVGVAAAAVKFSVAASVRKRTDSFIFRSFIYLLTIL